MAGLPTQVSIYDEIGYYGVAAGEFMADLKGVSGDIELHINSPGGDVHDGIAIFNQLKQRAGIIHVIIDGLAASAASFIAQAASPGKLEIAPHAQMMVHNGFSMAIGDANDLRKTADLLDMITTEIASIYAERSGKPADFWLAKMAAETWYTDKQAVAEGLADNIHGQQAPAAQWDLSVYGHAPAAVVNADGNHAPMKGSHNHSHPAYGSQGSDSVHSHEHSHDGDASHGHSHAAAGAADGAGADAAGADGSTGPQDAAVTQVRNAGGGQGSTDGGGSPVAPEDLGDGWVCDPDGQVRFDPDGDGDDDSQAASDSDHDYWSEDGKPLKTVPPKPRTDVQEPVPVKPGASDRALFPVLNADVDSSAWDASRAWKAGAASDDPAAFYKGICAGRKAGDPSVQSSWALPYRYSPSGAPNAAGVRDALSRLPQTHGLTNADEAKSKLQGLMKQVNPDYDPDTYTDLVVDAAMIAGILAVPEPVVDDGGWNPGSALALAAKSGDPAAFYRGICAGRRQGNPATAAAWALPYRYTPGSPPNARGVREALAELPSRTDLANHAEARGVLERALKAISPDPVPDDDIDPELLAAAFALGLKGASK